MEPTTLKLHHIVILVKDLQKAIDDYVKLGFTVASGGVHFGGISQNALILLEDATYLELLAIRPGIKTFLLKALYKTGILGLFRKSRFGMAFRFYGRAFDANEGIIDFALLYDLLLYLPTDQGKIISTFEISLCNFGDFSVSHFSERQ